MAQTSGGHHIPKLNKEEAQLIGNSILHDLKVRGLRHKTARSFHGQTCFKRAARVARLNLSVWLRDGQMPKHSARFLLDNDESGRTLEKFGILRIAEVSAVMTEDTSQQDGSRSSMHAPPAAYIPGTNYNLLDATNLDSTEDPEPMDYTGEEEVEEEGGGGGDRRGEDHTSVEYTDAIEPEASTAPQPLFNVSYLPTDGELRVFEEQLLQVDYEELSRDGEDSRFFGENGALISSVQSFLTKMKRGCIERQTLTEILRGWAVKYHASDASITELLLLLKLLRPDPEYEKLPWSARQLFKIRQNELDTYIIRDLADYQQVDQSFPENSKEVVPISTEDEEEGTAAGYEADLEADDDAEEGEDEQRLIKTSLQQRGKQLYVHFGIEKAILGKSPGVIYNRKYQQVMRVIGTVNPELLTLELKKVFNSADLIYEEARRLQQNRPDYIGALTTVGSTQGAREKPIFTLDVNINGVQMFKDNKGMHAIPILGRLHSVGPVKIPVRKSPPFLIGFYYGEGAKPNQYAFLYDFVNEIKHLHPDNKSPGYLDKAFHVMIRAFICDAPMRSYLKGVVSFNGYWSCERCKTRGRPNKSGRGIHFPDLNCEYRKFEEWNDYFKKDNQGRSHRKVLSPLDSIKDLDKIAAFSLDAMHSIDGGVVPTSLVLLFQIGQPSKNKILKRANLGRRPLSETVMNYASRAMSAWKTCAPSECARRVRSLVEVGKWKMLEGRTFLMYICVPLFLVLDDAAQSEFDIMKHLLLGVRLISGYTLEPIKEEDLRRSQASLLAFVRLLMGRFGKEIAIPKLHFLPHIVDDVRNFDVHVDALSAYPFENQQRFYRDLLHTGKGVIPQIVKGLVRYQKFAFPWEQFDDEPESYEELLEKVIANEGHLQIPPMTLRKGGIVHTSQTDKAVCEGFTITNRFPNNVVRVGKKEVHIVTEIWTGPEGDAAMKAHQFRTVRSAFKEPYDSHDVRAYIVTNLEPRPGILTLSSISGKFFACHLNIDKEPNPLATLKGEAQGQKWCLILLRHSEAPS